MMPPAQVVGDKNMFSLPILLHRTGSLDNSRRQSVNQHLLECKFLFLCRALAPSFALGLFASVYRQPSLTIA